MLLCALTEACGDVSFVEELPRRLGFSDVTLDVAGDTTGRIRCPPA